MNHCFTTGEPMLMHLKPTRQTARPTPRRATLVILLSLICATALAESATRHFSIPAQALDDALMQFGTDTNLRLLFTADKVRGLTSGRLDGNMTNTQALSQLLKGSGLGYRFVDAGTVTVDAPDGNLIKTAAVDETAQPQMGEGQMMPKVTVEADADNPYQDPNWTNDPYNPDYIRPNSTTATKTDTPLLQTPFSVQIVPKQVLDDQQVIRVQEALKNIAGVGGAVSFKGIGNDAVTLRGFTTEYQTNGAIFYREGVRMAGLPTSFANTERVELLKGPASVLYGRAEPGGLINIVPKDALAVPYYSIQQQFGSYDLYRTSIDATGPINKNNSLLYRFNLEYADSNSFRDIAYHRNITIAPSITWNVSDKTKVEFEFDYTHREFVEDNGIPALGKRPAPIPITRWLGDFSEQHKEDVFLVDLDISHRFNDNWKLDLKGLAAHQDVFIFNAVPFDLNEQTGEINRGLYLEDGTNRDWWYGSGNLSGKLSLLGMRHNLLVGAEYYSDFYNQPLFFPDLPSINIFNPIYNRFVDNQGFRDRNNPANNFTDFRSITQWWGISIQDQVDITDQLHLLLGGRYDNSESLFDAADQPLINESALKPRFGIVYQPKPWLSLYGHYLESFGRNNSGRSRTNQTFPSETAEQFEAGIKTEWLDGKLTSTLAYYNLTKQNISTPDPDDPTRTFNITTGEARSQGLELDISGQLTDALSIIGSYAYTDTKITKDTTVDDQGNFTRLGNRLPNAALHAGSLWAKWDFQQPELQGFSLGAGVYLAGQRQGDFENSYQLPGYARLDAMAAYQWKIGDTKLSAQLNVNNLLDKQYYKGTYNNRNVIFPGEPLTFMGSIRLQY